MSRRRCRRRAAAAAFFASTSFCRVGFSLRLLGKKKVKVEKTVETDGYVNGNGFDRRRVAVEMWNELGFDCAIC